MVSSYGSYASSVARWSLGSGLLAIAIVTAAAVPLALSSAAQEPPAELAPEIDLRDVRTNANVSLQAYRGQTVLVVFCASWVSACRNALPAAEAFASRSGSNVRVVAVSLDNPDFTPADVAAFANELGVSAPFVRDGGRRLARAFNVRRLPATYVVGADGSLRSSLLGFSESYEADLGRSVEGTEPGRIDAGRTPMR